MIQTSCGACRKNDSLYAKQPSLRIVRVATLDFRIRCGFLLPDDCHVLGSQVLVSEDSVRFAQLEFTFMSPTTAWDVLRVMTK